MLLFTEMGTILDWSNYVPENPFETNRYDFVAMVISGLVVWLCVWYILHGTPVPEELIV